MTGLVVDTSAAVAIITDETHGDQLAGILAGAEIRLMAAATLVELGIVIESRLGPAGQAVVSQFLSASEIDIVPVGADLAELALQGWRRYGKGRHPAQLNYGDCFTYALAIQRSLPVLCTGEDFARSDAAVLTIP